MEWLECVGMVLWSPGGEGPAIPAIHQLLALQQSVVAAVGMLGSVAAAPLPLPQLAAAPLGHAEDRSS